MINKKPGNKIINFNTTIKQNDVILSIKHWPHNCIPVVYATYVCGYKYHVTSVGSRMFASIKLKRLKWR